MNVDAIAAAVLAGAEKLIAKAVEPLHARIAELEGRSAESPAPEDIAAEAAKLILSGDGIKSLVDLEVTAYMEANPPEKGEKGDPGEKGLDGAGVADLLIDREGALVATLTDGRMKNLGGIVGKDGTPGRDGKDYSGLEVSRTYDADTHEVVERWGEKELRYPAGGIRHGGYWREGAEVKAAETWTHAGIAWIAKRDTTQKPDRNSEDWEIFASKGRDGKDLRDAPVREPIRVGHG